MLGAAGSVHFLAKRCGCATVSGRSQTVRIVSTRRFSRTAFCGQTVPPLARKWTRRPRNPPSGGLNGPGAPRYLPTRLLGDARFNGVLPLQRRSAHG
eukprot:678937-Rhodomonas_salina.1